MKTSPIRKIFLALAAVGIVTFLVVLFTRHPERAWQAYLINFLVWSAIAQGARDRLRAVILTSATTIGGILPLIFETDLQAQFLIPMAVTLAFGLLV